MIVSELYTVVCSEKTCHKTFKAVSRAARYCSDTCRNKSYRRRKANARDGILPGVPKLYDNAVSYVLSKSSESFEALQSMSLCGAPYWSVKYAVYAAYCVACADVPFESDYQRELRADVDKRFQDEIFKYVPMGELP